ncbi:MAG: hypothetical protein EXR71_20275 [Myxococcales bacterium]|nr:hypothetical protein [Myxococcales bacterium]
MRALSTIAILILACTGGGDPDPVAAYVIALEPAMADNAALAQRFLTEASRIKKVETDGAQLAEVIAKELAPKADELARAAAAVSPMDPRLTDPHAVLVKAWADRAWAYGAMRDAWAAGDLIGWDAAVKKNTQSKLDEERYFGDLNALLAPEGLVLRQYPPPAPAAP